jgi:peptidyl-prolyl cis-trans isomerase B (cyclophilin B)
VADFQGPIHLSRGPVETEIPAGVPGIFALGHARPHEGAVARNGRRRSGKRGPSVAAGGFPVPGLRLAQLALLLLAATAAAVDVPAGPMPRIDGEVADAEWHGASKLETPAGTARLRVAGRVLCIAIEMRRPYGGERIDLHVADQRQNWSWHSLHPACTIPPRSLFPIAPVLVRRGSFTRSDKAPIDPPRACLFRARVYEEESSWSAEVAVALQALGVSPLGRIVFQLAVRHPAGEKGIVHFVPGGEDPRTWPPLVAGWPQIEEPFMTREEDARRTLELGIFKERLDAWTQREIRKPVLGAALDKQKNNRKIQALRGQLMACVEADPGDFFARVNLVHFLRRANRLEEAEAAATALEKQFPFARSDWAVVNARRALLFARGRFAEGLKLPLPNRDAPAAKELVEAWDEEAAARLLEGPDLPRVAFETTKGRIVVALFEKDAPRSVAHLLELVKAGHYAGASFADVTGSAGARAKAKPPAKRLPHEKSRRRAWRGTLAFVWENGSAGADLRFLTGHGRDAAVGRVIEGMEFVDALEAGDRIESARVARP